MATAKTFEEEVIKVGLGAIWKSAAPAAGTFTWKALEAMVKAAKAPAAAFFNSAGGAALGVGSAGLRRESKGIIA